MASAYLSRAALCGALLLAGCNDAPSPLTTQPLRQGADQQTLAIRGLPPPPTSRYEASIAPENEARGLKVGELVNGKGGQQVQKEKEKKEQAAVEAEQARQRAAQVRQQRSDERVSTE